MSPPPTPTTANNSLFYNSLGMNLRPSRDPTEFVGQCPFCLTEKHFMVSRKQGIYNCLLCGRNGNHYTFLQDLYKESIQTTTSADYETLSQNRGLTTKTLQVAGLAKSSLRPDVWLLPSRSQEGKILNLYQAIPIKKDQPHETPSRPTNNQSPVRGLGTRPPPNRSLRLQQLQQPTTKGTRRPPVPRSRPNHANGSPNQRTAGSYEIRSASSPCTQQLYGLESYADQRTVILCEGHWDRLAMWEILASLELPSTGEPSGLNPFLWNLRPHRGLPNYFNPILSKVAVLGVPGCNIFKADWCRLFRNCLVIILYDNDPDRVICSKCRGTEGYKAHPAHQPCPLCNGNETTGTTINPGKDGMRKVLKEFADTGVDVDLLQINWKPEDPKDIRDLLNL